MQVPLELTFDNMKHSEAIESRVRQKVQHLEKLYGRITSCRVTVEMPHKHHRQGNKYNVRVFLSVPEGQVIVNRDPGDFYAHEDVYVAIRDAFDAAGRQLQDHQRKIRGDVKSHETPLQGRIAQLFPEQDYGFIATADGREIYFHRNAVVNGSFEDLEADQTVELVVFSGDSAEGPHASTVRPIGAMRYEPTK